MPVSTEVGVGVYLKSLADFGVQRDSLRLHGLEVLHKVDYRVPVRRPWILGEAGALMCCIGYVRPSALLEEVDFSHYISVGEVLAKRRRGSVTTQDLRG